MTVHNFEPISYTVMKSLPCPVCGKRLIRQKTFTQTLNPFNKHRGKPKTRARILRELEMQADHWTHVPEPHRECSA